MHGGGALLDLVGATNVGGVQQNQFRQISSSTRAEALSVLIAFVVRMRNNRVCSCCITTLLLLLLLLAAAAADADADADAAAPDADAAAPDADAAAPAPAPAAPAPVSLGCFVVIGCAALLRWLPR